MTIEFFPALRVASLCDNTGRHGGQKESVRSAGRSCRFPPRGADEIISAVKSGPTQHSRRASPPRQSRPPEVPSDRARAGGGRLPIEFPCVQCGELVANSGERQAGKKDKCPHCRAVVDIPKGRIQRSEAGQAAAVRRRG